MARKLRAFTVLGKELKFKSQHPDVSAQPHVTLAPSSDLWQHCTHAVHLHEAEHSSTYVEVWDATPKVAAYAYIFGGNEITN